MTNQIADQYKAFFERISQHVPRTSYIDAPQSSSFWEDLYQAFKARLIAELEPGEFL